MFQIINRDKHRVNCEPHAQRVRHWCQLTRMSLEQNGLPFTFSTPALSCLQQVYTPETQYITAASQLRADLFRAELRVQQALGIRRKLTYVPGTTITAMVSQASALLLWSVLRLRQVDPSSIYTTLVAGERIGFRSENIIFHERLPMGSTISAAISVASLRVRRDVILARQHITLDGYAEARVSAFCFM